MSIEYPSFEEAVHLFKRWGFLVEPGPQPDEVTLIVAGADYRTYAVYEARLLPQIASAILHVRWQNVGRRFDQVGFVERLVASPSSN
jgi:hypothetical protein